MRRSRLLARLEAGDRRCPADGGQPGGRSRCDGARRAAAPPVGRLRFAPPCLRRRSGCTPRTRPPATRSGRTAPTSSARGGGSSPTATRAASRPAATARPSGSSMPSRTAGREPQVLATEARPVLQGARLTAWELMRSGVDIRLIPDGAAGFAMARGMVDAVIVGCDRVAANGDTANKIGTYQLAVLANRHGIPFYVAGPRSSFDADTPTGAEIVVEERNRRRGPPVPGRPVGTGRRRRLEPCLRRHARRPGHSLHHRGRCPSAAVRSVHPRCAHAGGRGARSRRDWSGGAMTTRERPTDRATANFDASTRGRMSDEQTKELLCQLLRAYYERNWVAGTGGGICGPTEDGFLFLAPTGVHKELVQPRDFFVVDPADGSVVRPPEDPALRPSECGPIFCASARIRGAGSSMHSHALIAVLAGDLGLATGGDHLAISGLEMLKGIRGGTNEDVHLVPIIRNTARERDLVAQVEATLRDPRFAHVLRDPRRRSRRVHLGRRRLGDQASRRGLSLPVRGGSRPSRSIPVASTWRSPVMTALGDHDHDPFLCPNCQQPLPHSEDRRRRRRGGRGGRQAPGDRRVQADLHRPREDEQRLRLPGPRRVRSGGTSTSATTRSAMSWRAAARSPSAASRGR